MTVAVLLDSTRNLYPTVPKMELLFNLSYLILIVAAAIAFRCVRGHAFRGVESVYSARSFAKSDTRTLFLYRSTFDTRTPGIRRTERCFLACTPSFRSVTSLI
jgi:hypothetical protein